MNKYKLFVMDVDGTLTDGKIYMSADGEMFKAFDIKDGYGIKHILPQMGIKTAIITGRESDIVKRRAEELDVDYLFQGVSDKVRVVKKLVKSMNISLEDVVYIGDDINDLPCIELINGAGGMTICPRDAITEIQQSVKVISKFDGGKGAVRNVIQLLENKRL